MYWVLCDLNGDSGATLGATCIDDRAATGGFHADAKAVGLFAAGDGRLVSAFHNKLDLVKNNGKCAEELSIILFYQPFGQAPAHFNSRPRQRRRPAKTDTKTCSRGCDYPRCHAVF